MLRLQQNPRVAANVTAARGMRGTIADIEELKTALPRLPDTATELRQIAASVEAPAADVVLGLDATETRVKQTTLDQYRIVYFATHGLLAGEVAEFAKLNAEPALVLTLPEKPTELDDGLLTASEVAQLKLNADWVVLSACNTAAGDKPGAEALSGLARAFFYAGGRSLLVSNWEVETKSAVDLMVATFAAIAADPKLSHGEALQKSMLAMIGNAQHPEWADPKFWAPFVVVGEPAKPQTPARPDPETMTAARELVATMGVVADFKTFLPIVFQTLRPGLVQGRPKQYEEAYDVIVPLLLEGAGSRAGEVTDQVGALYGQTFTIDEMRQLTAFYHTPVGQKVLQALTAISQQTMAIGQPGRKNDDELRDKMAVAAVHGQAFTADEMRQITAFSHTQVGQKFLQKLPAISQQTLTLGQVLGRKISDELRDKMADELRKRGLDPKRAQ
jgi:hypothetical protein